jgi:hypothetical protein
MWHISGESRCKHKILVDIPEKRVYLEKLGVDMKIILKWPLKE